MYSVSAMNTPKLAPDYMKTNNKNNYIDNPDFSEQYPIQGGIFPFFCFFSIRPEWVDYCLLD